MRDKSHSSRLALNSIYSLLGQGLPSILGFICIPLVLERIGEANFGLLSLAWVFLNISVVLNLGIGRATTKYASEELAKGGVEHLFSVVWLSLAANIIVGFLFGIIALGVIRPIVSEVINVPGEYQANAITMFQWLAFSLPFILGTTTFRGVLEGRNSFIVTNVIKSIFNGGIFAIPLICVLTGRGLAEIGFWLAFSRLVEFIVYLWITIVQVPHLCEPGKLRRSDLYRLLSFGGWVSVSTFVQPIFGNFDRILLGKYAGIASVAHYSVPVDTISRISIIPGSIATPLFPLLSAYCACCEQAKAEKIHNKVLKYLVLLMGLGSLILVSCAAPLLGCWLGSNLYHESIIVAQIAAVGLLFNAIAYMPFTYLQAAGRPDSTAKLHLIELPIVALLTWWAILRFGIIGAAIVWSFRMLFDAAMLLLLCRFHGLISKNGIRDARLDRAFYLQLLPLSGSAIIMFDDGFILRVITTIIIFVSAVLTSYFWVLDDRERKRVWTSLIQG